MAGTIVSKYWCDTKSWESFQENLGAAELYIEQEGSLETHIFYDIKAIKNGPHGVFLTAKLERSTEMQNRVNVKMTWIVKNAGTEPLSSFHIAAQIEKLILDCSGISYHAPVQSKTTG
jgi:hypothetical protein